MIRSILNNLKLSKKGSVEAFALIILFIIILVFFSRLFYPSPSFFITPEFASSDIVNFDIPRKAFLSESFKNLTVPLWNKNIGTGFPLFAEATIGTFFIPNLLLFSLLPYWLAFNLGYILSFLLTAAGLYYLAKKLKFSPLNSFFISLVFTFSGLMITRINHFAVLQTISLMPWLFLLAIYFLETGKLKFYFLFIFLLAQQIFAGFIQTTILTYFLIAIYISFIGKLKIKKILRNLGWLFFALLFAITLTAVQILPTIELVKHSNRAQGLSLTTAIYFSYPLKQFITYLNPFLLGKPSDGSYPHYSKNGGSIFWENTGYIGIIPLVFVIISLINISKNRTIRIFVLVLFLSLLLMLGKFSPAYFLFSIFPFNYLRVPSRFIIPATLSLTILAGFGLQIFEKKISKFKKFKKLKYLLFIFIFSLIIFDVFQKWFYYHPTYNITKWLEPPKTAQILKKNGQNQRIYTVGQGLLWSQYYSEKGWKSNEPYYYFRNELSNNENILFNIPQFDMYVVLWINRYVLYKSLLNFTVNLENNSFTIDETTQKLLNASSIKYLISPYNLINKNYDLIDTIQNNQNFLPYKIYENKAALNRARIVYSYIKTGTVKELNDLLLSDNFNPQREVILEKDVNYQSPCAKEGQNCPNYQLDWLSDKDQKIVIKITAPEKGILVLADTYYPGWKAYIDGQETEIFAANLNQRAIIVEKGTHLVKFIYQPNSFKTGFLISALSHLVIIFLAVFGFFSSSVQKYRNSHAPYFHL